MSIARDFLTALEVNVHQTGHPVCLAEHRGNESVYETLLSTEFQLIVTVRPKYDRTGHLGSATVVHKPKNGPSFMVAQFINNFDTYMIGKFIVAYFESESGQSY